MMSGRLGPDTRIVVSSTLPTWTAKCSNLCTHSPFSLYLTHWISWYLVAIVLIVPVRSMRTTRTPVMKCSLALLDDSEPMVFVCVRTEPKKCPSLCLRSHPKTDEGLG